MMKIAMSPAASALLRILIARAGAERSRILLTDAHSTDWRSLTFEGERHHLTLRLTGADSPLIADRMCDGLEDAEFSIPGIIVADIRVIGAHRSAEAATEVIIEALTISAD